MQSSAIYEGNLFFHAAVAASTTALAATSSLSALHTIDATSSLLSTSHTYKQEKKKFFIECLGKNALH